jgi:hypothetical protein
MLLAFIATSFFSLQKPISAKPPQISINPDNPAISWQPFEPLLPGESILFAVAEGKAKDADGKIKNGFRLIGEPQFLPLGVNTLWSVLDDSNPYVFEAVNNSAGAFRNNFEVRAFWKSPPEPPSPPDEESPDEEIIIEIPWKTDYSERVNFVWNFGTKMGFSDGKSTISFSVTASTNGITSNLADYKISNTAEWVGTETVNNQNSFEGSIKSDSPSRGFLTIIKSGGSENMSSTEIAFAKLDLGITKSGDETDLAEDRHASDETPHETDPGCPIITRSKGGSTNFPRTKLTLSGSIQNPGYKPEYKLTKSNNLTKVKIYTAAEGGQQISLPKTWDSDQFGAGKTLYIESDSFSPEDKPEEGNLTLAYSCDFGGEFQTIKDEVKLTLGPAE